jgi:hypothetical protein
VDFLLAKSSVSHEATLWELKDTLCFQPSSSRHLVDTQDFDRITNVDYNYERRLYIVKI